MEIVTLPARQINSTAQYTSKMITVRLKIGNGPIEDTRNISIPNSEDKIKLVYISSDHRFAASLKDLDTTTYPEEEGEHIIPKAVDAPFDYKVTFYVDAEGTLENANQKIAAFNALLNTQNSYTKVRTLNKVWFYNDYKKVLIVGYPKPISEATDFWRDSAGKAHDIVLVEWTIRVTKPSECNFNLESED